MSISFKQLNNKINSIRFNERLVWTAIKSVIQTITGNAPLILTNAVNNSITSLTQYGKCTQNGTPTPSAPVDIMCNNGALKWDSVNQRVYVDGTPEVLTVGGPNLLNTATNITGKYISANGSIINSDDAQYTDLIPVKAGETYMASLVSGRNSGTNRWHGYDANGGWVKQLIYMSATGQQGVKFVMSATIDSGISYVRLSYGITDTEAMICVSANQEISWDGFYKSKLYHGVCVDNMSKLTSPYITQGAYGGGPCIVCAVEPGKTYTVSHNITGPTKYLGSFFTEAEDVTDGSKSIEGRIYFELSASEPCAFIAPESAHYVVISFNTTKTATYIFDDKSVVVITNDAIDYSHYVPPQTASVPMLLSVGDVKDEAEIISGLVTRRVTACLYDGTQDIGDTYLSTTGGKDIGAIIVYPLATPATERIAGQNLVTNEGTNIVDVTAEVSPIELKVEFSQTKE